VYSNETIRTGVFANSSSVQFSSCGVNEALRSFTDAHLQPFVQYHISGVAFFVRHVACVHDGIITGHVNGQCTAISRVRQSVFTLSFEPAYLRP